MFLDGQDPLSESTVCDIVRGAIEFDNMDKMTKALEYLFACDPRFKEGQSGGMLFGSTKSMPKIRMRRVKDRMAEPTEGGMYMACQCSPLPAKT